MTSEKSQAVMAPRASGRGEAFGGQAGERRHDVRFLSEKSRV